MMIENPMRLVMQCLLSVSGRSRIGIRGGQPVADRRILATSKSKGTACSAEGVRLILDLDVRRGSERNSIETLDERTVSYLLSLASAGRALTDDEEKVGVDHVVSSMCSIRSIRSAESLRCSALGSYIVLGGVRTHTGTHTHSMS